MTLLAALFRLWLGKFNGKPPSGKLTNSRTDTHTHTCIRAGVQAETAVISQVLSVSLREKLVDSAITI